MQMKKDRLVSRQGKKGRNGLEREIAGSNKEHHKIFELQIFQGRKVKGFKPYKLLINFNYQ